MTSRSEFIRSLSRELTEPDDLAELRAERTRRAALASAHAKLENALELLAVDAVDDAIDVLSEALTLLEVAE